jgi:hypothetical protein
MHKRQRAAALGRTSSFLVNAARFGVETTDHSKPRVLTDRAPRDQPCRRSGCRSASFETRSCGALLRMRSFVSVIYLTLRRPEGPSRRVPTEESRVFPHPALMFAFKSSGAIFVSAAAEGAGSEVRTAGDRTRRRRLNKLSCAGWLPHDRGFVSGLPRSRGERRSGDRLITGQEGSPPWSCRRRCAPLDLLASTSFPVAGGQF